MEEEGLIARFIWALVFGIIAGFAARLASPDGQSSMHAMGLTAIVVVIFMIARRKILTPELLPMLIISAVVFKFVAPLVIGKGTELPEIY